MSTTAENRIASDAKVLDSYLGGKWQTGAQQGTALVDPTTGEIVAWAGSQGLDLQAALAYSAMWEAPELRQLFYGQRAVLLGKIADVLASGATGGSKSPAKIPATPRPTPPSMSTAPSAR